MHVAVFLFFLKSRVIIKGIGRRMLEDEKSSLPEQTTGDTRGIEHLVRNRIQPLYRIGRIREDYIEVQAADIQEIEDIVPYHVHAADAEGGGGTLDERGVKRVHLDRIDLRHSPGGELIGYTPGAREEIQDPGRGEVAGIVQDIEQSLLGKVRCRTGPEALWRHDRPPFQRTSYNPHESCFTPAK